MRRLSLVLIALSLALAGCAKPAAELDPASAAPLPEGVSIVSRAASANGVNASMANASSMVAATALPTLTPLTFSAPVDLPIVGTIGAGEPNIAALPDGTLFATSPAGGTGMPNHETGAAYLWRSKDGGATWETLRAPIEAAPLPFLFCSCDADVITSPDGYVYYSDWWIALATGNYLVERSADGGETWESATITTREALGSVDRQWLVAGEDGFVGLFYSHFPPTPFQVSALEGILPDLDVGIHAVFSTDHGATWGDPVVVVAPADGHALQIGHPRLLPDGTLVMPYGDVEASETFWRDPSMVMLAVSNDQGATWEQRPVADVPKGFDNLWAVQGDVDASGAIHVAWSARVDDDVMATYVATSRDVGESWTPPLALRAEGLNFLPWLSTGPNGTIAVGWYGGNATGDPVEAEGAWFAYVAESRDGGESFIVQKVSDEPVKEGNLCPKGAACNGDRELLDYVSMVYDASGTMHFAFARSDDGVAVTRVASTLSASAAGAR